MASVCHLRFELDLDKRVEHGPSLSQRGGLLDNDRLQSNEGGRSVKLSGQQLHGRTPGELNQFSTLYFVCPEQQSHLYAVPSLESTVEQYHTS